MKTSMTLALLTLAVIACAAQAQPAPKLLPFQGRLSDANGGPLSNGLRLIRFEIFDAPIAGNRVWPGELHRATINGSLVNVVLGSKTSLAGVDFDQQLFLEIAVDSNGDGAITTADPPMLPRQALVPVIYAKESSSSRSLAGYDWSSVFGVNDPATGKLDGTRIKGSTITAAQIAPSTITSNQIAAQTVHGSLIAPASIAADHLTQALLDLVAPPGSVTAYMGTNAPTGWLLCDGSIVEVRSFPRLFAVLGNSSGSGTNSSSFRLPDLRGMFLRGVDASPDLPFPASAVTVSSNSITVPNHGMTRNGYPVWIRNISGALPGGLLSTNADGSLHPYFTIVVDASTLKLAASASDAFVNKAIAITAQGTGTNIFASAADPDKNGRTAPALGGNVGRLVGSVQADQLASHIHNLSHNITPPGGGPIGGSGPRPARAPDDDNYISAKATGGTETRPKNVYVNYIIKY